MQRYPLFENLRAKPPLQKMELSPLFTTDTKTVPVSPLFAVDTNLKDLKSFVINLIRKRVGVGDLTMGNSERMPQGVPPMSNRKQMPHGVRPGALRRVGRRLYAF